MSALGPLTAAQMTKLIEQKKVYRTTTVTVGSGKKLTPLGAIDAFATAFPALTPIKSVGAAAEQRPVPIQNQAGAESLKDRVAAYLQSGRAYFAKGEMDRAIADYDQAIRLDPESLAAYMCRSLAYKTKGDNDHVIADCSQVIRLNTEKLDNTSFWVMRGGAYFAKGEMDRAIADYDQAIRLDPKEPAYLTCRGVVFEMRGDAARARADYETALALASDDSEATQGLARLAAAGGAPSPTSRRVNAAVEQALGVSKQGAVIAPPPAFVQNRAGDENRSAAKFSYVGFWPRAGAYIIDVFALLLVLAIVSAIAAVIGGMIYGFDNIGEHIISLMSDPRFANGVTVSEFVIFGLFYGGFLSSKWQATPGKRLMGMRVIRTNGKPIGFWFGVGRFFAYYISMIPLGIGFLMIAWSDEKKALHDRICGTRVVRAEETAQTAARLVASPQAQAAQARQAQEDGTGATSVGRAYYYPPSANLWPRLGAALYDAFLVLVIDLAAVGLSFMAFFFVSGFVGGAQVVDSSFDERPGHVLFMYFIYFLVFMTSLSYYVAFSCGRWQATPGKRYFGMRIIRNDGQPVGLGTALGRFFGYYISTLPLYFGFLMIFWDKEKKGLHDKICGTRVVRLPEAEAQQVRSRWNAWNKGWGAGIIGVAVAIRLGISVLRIFTGEGLPACDSSEVKNGLSEIFKSVKVEVLSYAEIKTLTTAKEANTCSAVVEDSSGAKTGFEYRVYFEGKEAKVIVTSTEDKPAAGPVGQTSPGAKEKEANEKDCTQDSDVERRIAGCTRLAIDASETTDRRSVAFFNRASAYYAKADYDSAVADYNEAIRLDPNYSDAYGNRGNAYYAKGDYDRAIAEYTVALRLNAKDAVGFNNRGQTYFAKGDFDRAVADYNQAIKLDPNNGSFYDNRGCAYVRKNALAKAEADFDRALKNTSEAGFTPGRLCVAELEALRSSRSKR